MADRLPRLGDVIEDYCPRCRLLLNHDVASLYQGEVAKVTCRTCYNGHDFKHAQVPSRRKSKKDDKGKLFDAVLSNLSLTPTQQPPPQPVAPAAPPARKKRDLWAEVERLKKR
jgi:hypothetical protein